MLEEQFKKYVSNYDSNDEHISLKINHSFRVMALQEKYAKLLKFSTEDQEIAKIIGLLHDFGRFEQWRVYHTFVDTKSVDHADYSVEVLFNQNEISKFDIPSKWYDIIKFAIKNHNKLQIEPTEDERKIKHAKLIRDTDKIDILYLLGELGELNNQVEEEPITKLVENEILQGKDIDRRLLKNKNDRYALKFAFAFNIYNDECLEEFYHNLKTYYTKQLKSHKYFKKIYEYVSKYCEERIDKNVRNKI